MQGGGERRGRGLSWQKKTGRKNKEAFGGTEHQRTNSGSRGLLKRRLKRYLAVLAPTGFCSALTTTTQPCHAMPLYDASKTRQDKSRSQRLTQSAVPDRSISFRATMSPGSRTSVLSASPGQIARDTCTAYRKGRLTSRSCATPARLLQLYLPAYLCMINHATGPVSQAADCTEITAFNA